MEGSFFFLSFLILNRWHKNQSYLPKLSLWTIFCRHWSRGTAFPAYCASTKWCPSVQQPLTPERRAFAVLLLTHTTRVTDTSPSMFLVQHFVILFFESDRGLDVLPLLQGFKDAEAVDGEGQMFGTALEICRRHTIFVGFVVVWGCVNETCSVCWVSPLGDHLPELELLCSQQS